uniref:Uncharacterized protein n=1 Tax=Oryza barthii TaxID=65489 RepID=A0A0D3FPN3_9ORYZ
MVHVHTAAHILGREPPATRHFYFSYLREPNGRQQEIRAVMVEMRLELSRWEDRRRRRQARVLTKSHSPPIQDTGQRVPHIILTSVN